MKKLLLLWLFSCSLDGFSQVNTDKLYLWPDGKYSVLDPGATYKIDTIRATLIVYHDGEASIVHTKAGFVVTQYGKDEIYLDDRQRVIKYPLEVLTYKLRRAKQ